MLTGHRLNIAQATARIAHFSARPSWQKRQHAGWHSLRNHPGRADRVRPPIFDHRTVRILRLLLAVISLPLLILLWWWIIPHHIPTPLLVIGVSDYQAPRPLNAFAEDDLVRFKKTFQTDKHYKNIQLHGPKKPPKNSTELKHEITVYLRNTLPGGPSENVVLIYLSLHGVVNALGEPCLLLPEDDPLHCDKWMPISKLFNILTTANGAKGRKIVLLLDAGRMDDCWEMGILCNTFAIALQDYLERQPPPHCVVISATSGLDVALTAPEISGTPFGYYVADGLRGAADGAINGKPDRVVSLEELQTYVCKHVDQWARENRGISQRPFFYAGTDEGLENLAIAHVEEAENGNLPTHPWKSPNNMVKIKRCVDRIPPLYDREVWRFDPLSWARVQFLLQRLDAELLGGVAYVNNAQTTLQSLEKTLANLGNETIYHEFTPISLAMQQRLDEDDQSDALRDKVKPYWDAWLKDPHSLQEVKPPLDYQRATAFTWDHLISTDDTDHLPLDRKIITDSLHFCDAARRAPNLERVEMAMLRLLNQHVDWDSRDIKKREGTPLLRRLLQARQQSEKLAAPEDPRQHYAIAPQLAQVDQQLAFAFDQVLVGSGRSLDEAKDRIDFALHHGKTNNGGLHYRQVDKISEQVLRAMRVRDQAFASSLQLARWLVRKAKHDPAPRSPLNQVNRLVTQTCLLAEEIDRWIQQPPSSPQGMLDETERWKLTNSVDTTLAALLGTYRARTDELSKEKGSTKDWLLELPRHLRSPITIDKNYCALRQKNIHLGSHAPTTIQTTPFDAPEYLRWLTIEAVPAFAELFDWAGDVHDEHPQQGLTGTLKLATVNDQSSPVEIAKLLATLGGNIRQRLNDVSRQCATLHDRTAKLLAKQPVAQARKGLSQADCLSRVLAPLLTQSRWSEPGSNPAKKLRQLDVHALLVWRGQRLLDDFWGGWEREPVRYFETATKHLQQQLPDTNVNFPVPFHDAIALGKRLNNLKSLFNGVWKSPLRVHDLLLDNHDAYVHYPLNFVTNEKTPSGMLAVYLSDRNGDLFRTYDQSHDARRRWSFPTTPESVDLQLKTAELQQLGKTSRLEANALFRGHQWHEPFSLGQGQSYEWEQPQPAPAMVVVEGDSKLISNLIIIFDCSGSMAGGRIQRGKAALIEILDQLANEKDQYRVGLILFGHRAGWQENAPLKVKRCNPNFNDQPWEDVELVFAPKLLKDQYRDELKNRLDQANTCRGETPLYRALILALKSFNPPNPDKPESFHILTVTDGVNWTDDADQIDAGDVLDELDRFPSRAQIDVIQFGAPTVFKNPTEEEKWRQGRPELKKICQHDKSKGSFYPAKDAQDELVRKLRESLHLHRYALRPARRGDTGEFKPSDLNDSISLDDPTTISPPSGPTEYEVHLLGGNPNPAPARIWVEGGEKLKLIYNHREIRFEYPYFDLDLRGDPLDSAKGFSIATHLPGLRGNVPVFRVSVQATEKTKFCRRPEVVWAKIRPVSGSSTPAYYFMDCQFESGLPVPMFQFPTPDWPRDKPARIELCLAMRRDGLMSKLIPVPVSESPIKEKFGDAALEIRSERDTTGAFRVVVDEKHGTRGDTFPLHLRIDPPPDNIRRVFFESERKANHVFSYKNRPAHGPAVHVLTRQQIERKGAGSFVFERVEVQ